VGDSSASRSLLGLRCFRARSLRRLPEVVADFALEIVVVAERIHVERDTASLVAGGTGCPVRRSFQEDGPCRLCS
jgi:hypothetical protein